MEEGSFRCDANISIRPEGSDKLLVKVEVKNMNSFKAVYLALEYEAERQRKAAAHAPTPVSGYWRTTSQTTRCIRAAAAGDGASAGVPSARISWWGKPVGSRW